MRRQDNLAKQAVHTGTASSTIITQDLYPLIHKVHYNMWHKQFRSSFKNPQSFCSMIQPEIPKLPFLHNIKSLSRYEITSLHRLRTGHTSLPHHLFRIHVINSDECPLHTAPKSICDLNHILFECHIIQHFRNQLYDALLKLKVPTPYSASSLLGSSDKNILVVLAKFIRGVTRFTDNVIRF